MVNHPRRSQPYQDELERIASNLRHSEKRLEAIICSAMDAIISINAEQRIVLFNPAAEKLFGLSADSALGRHINDFIPERFRHRHIQHVESYGRTGGSNRRMGHLGTLSALRANGEEFPIEAAISQMEANGEKLYTVILRDVTAKQEFQKQLEDTVAARTAQLQASVGELEGFSYSLTHDLRAPLRAMRNFAEMLVEDDRERLSSKGKEYLDRIVAAASRLDRLIQDVLDFSRLSSTEFHLEPVKLEPLLEQLVQEDEKLRPPNMRLEVRQPLLRVLAHEASITQCLTNLFSNARKFVEPGKIPRVRVYTESFGSRVRLWVEDDGIGIPKEAQSRLFGLFQRLHPESAYEGTGIGLSIVRKAVERMGGSVGVISEVGRGSRFWLELIRADEPLKNER